MKKQCLIIAMAIFLAYGSNALAAQTNQDDASIINEAWTAYNIGQYKKTINLITPLANNGNPRAQVILGRCFENGLGVDQDMAVATQWFQLAAEQDDSEAQVLLAYCYEVGAGVPKNPQQVHNLMLRAAEAGNPEAQFNIALHYSQGLNGAPKNERESFQWAQKSARQGYAQAERFLGACYEYGFGTTQDAAKATEWYARAQAKGLSPQGSIFNKVQNYEWTSGSQQ